MSRTQRPASRGLIGLLLLAVSIGLILIAYKTEKDRATVASSSPPAQLPASSIAEQLAPLSVVVDKTALDGRSPSPAPAPVINTELPATPLTPEPTANTV